MTILQLCLQLQYDIEQEKMYTILEFQYLFFEEPVKTINYLCFVYFTTIVYITDAHAWNRKLTRFWFDQKS